MEKSGSIVTVLIFFHFFKAGAPVPLAQ